MAKTKNNNNPDSPLSDEAMDRLAAIMNDSPSIVKLYGTEWEIHALKIGTQWLIAEETGKIVANEKMTMGDIIKGMAANLPSVCRVLTLALLNDKEKIYGECYNRIYDRLMWGEYKMRDWMRLITEIYEMMDVDFFIANTNALKTLRQKTLGRKTMLEEQK